VWACAGEMFARASGEEIADAAKPLIGGQPTLPPSYSWICPGRNTC
jgi:hypothetical protein